MRRLRLIAAILVLACCAPGLHAAGPDEIVTFGDKTRAAVYYPPDYRRNESGKRWPTLLFSHGFAGSALSQDELLDKIAGLGILVLAIEHSDPVAFERIPPAKRDRTWKILGYIRDHPFDRATYGYRPVEFAAFVKQATQRFPIDTRKVIFAGHSMGGYTILNAVDSAAVKPVGLIAYSVGEVTFKTKRSYFTDKQLAAITVPLLLVYGEDEPDSARGSYASEIQKHYGGPSYIVMIKGGGHLSYNDPTRIWGKRKRLEQINTVFGRTADFLAEVLH
jgi:pimeloyl-ACP methyl ester carboxylesterase